MSEVDEGNDVRKLKQLRDEGKIPRNTYFFVIHQEGCFKLQDWHRLPCSCDPDFRFYRRAFG